MKKFINLITEHPKLVISLNLLIIAILAFPIYRININPDLEALIPADDPELLRMEELEEEFGGLDIILISYHTEDVFAGSFATSTFDLHSAAMHYAKIHAHQSSGPPPSFRRSGCCADCGP